MEEVNPEKWDLIPKITALHGEFWEKIEKDLTENWEIYRDWKDLGLIAVPYVEGSMAFEREDSGHTVIEIKSGYKIFDKVINEAPKSVWLFKDFMGEFHWIPVWYRSGYQDEEGKIRERMTWR